MVSISCDNVNDVPIVDEWNFGSKIELLMHSIHAYPAKFPAFIASKAFDYAKNEGVDVKTVADVFCGCGTVALESKLHSKNFWGCDINPVATLIAKTKSSTYSIALLSEYYGKVKDLFLMDSLLFDDAYEKANTRLKYWFTEKNYLNLQKLKESIIEGISDEQYRQAFLCLFSSVLKNTSRWLSKSIKPQIDPNKKEADVWLCFSRQYEKFVKAVQQINECDFKETSIEIENKNFLEINDFPSVDLIISSPPYVTSYEYADLHQLSTLWLDYTDDFRTFRNGSIGSIYNSGGFEIDLNSLNEIGKHIVRELLCNRKATSKTKSVARYYVDIQHSIRNCYKMLNRGGMVFFIVGDTEYKNVKIRNSEHLIECLRTEGFSDIKAARRIISNKILTPYRDSIGRFSSDKSQRQIYHEEFVISGRR